MKNLNKEAVEAIIGEYIKNNLTIELIIDDFDEGSVDIDLKLHLGEELVSKDTDSFTYK